MVFKPVLVCSALALALLAPTAVQAATDADLAEIREQIRQLKESYETRIQALEQRLKDAEAKNAAPPAAPPVAAAPPEPPPPPPIAAAPGSGISAFNPGISAVLQGTYGNFSQDPNKYALSGFAPSGDIAPGKRGFNLGESELAISANVDDKFFGNLIVSLTPENTLSVEEAYGLYTGAGYGLAPKFGRFFSSLGYLNDQHQHVWDFVDAPLVYQAFLGGQYDVDGLQLKWLAPTDQFLEFGGELGNGEGFPVHRATRTASARASCTCNTGGDIDASNSWRAGLSICKPGHRIATTRRPTSWVTMRRWASAGAADSRSRTSSGSTRPTATRSRPTSSCRANTSGGGKRRFHYDRDNAQGLMNTANYGARKAASTCRRVPIHAGVADRRTLRLAQSGSGRLRRQLGVPRKSDVPPGAQHGDDRLDAVGIQSSALAVRTSKAATGNHRQRILRPIHPHAGRTWRPQILGAMP